jgi:hypothetical protein
MEYTLPEAAKELGVRPEALYKAQRLGYLPRRPHPSPPTPFHRWVLTEEDLDSYRRQHLSRRGRKPLVLKDDCV